MSRTLVRKLSPCALLLVPLLAPLTAAAQDAEIRPDIGFRLGATHTDNLGRDALEESATYGNIGVDLALTRLTPRVTMGVDGTVDYLVYDSDRFDNEAVGHLNAGLVYRLVPGIFQWQVNNNFGQVRRDPQRATGPDNREHLNVFTTGPDFFIPLGGRTEANFSARYIDRRYQESDRLDSDVWSAQLAVTRTLSQTRDIGLAGSGRRINYDSDVIDPYHIYSGFVTYDQRLARGAIRAEVGANVLDFDDRSRTGVLFGLNMSRELTARSTINLRARREFQDTGDVLRGRARRDTVTPEPVPEDGFEGTGELARTANPLTRTSAGIGYTLNRPRATFNLGSDVGDEEYERDSDADRRTLGVHSTFNWRFSPLTTGQINVRYRHERFHEVAMRANDWRALAAVSRQLGRQLDLRFEYRYSRRNTDRGVAFRENRVSVALRYSPLGW